MARIGFIGLGTMGRHIAINLAEAGHEARAHGEGSNGNQALYEVYDRLANQEEEEG